MTEQDYSSKIAQIIEAYPADRRFALAAMQDMQHAFNFIPEEGLVALADHLGCAVAQLYSMATFYKALSLTPKGDHIVKICNGTACHLRGAMNLATELKRNLGIDPGETTDDGAFSVELVNCLGSCALAPVMVVDGTYHNKLRVEQIPGIIESYASQGAEEVADHA
jgi:NADH-quinone oxidoreductase subunit E